MRLWHPGLRLLLRKNADFGEIEEANRNAVELLLHLLVLAH